MVGSSGDVNQGTTAGDDERVCRGQSVRSSEEASNDRGAKGRRKVVLVVGPRPSREGRRSAIRLSASVRRRTAWPTHGRWQWAGDWHQSIGVCRLESRMREIRPSGLGGRGSALRSSYPHLCPGGTARYARSNCFNIFRLAGRQDAYSLCEGTHAQESVDHRNHRPGRLVPGRAAFVQGLRGPWHYPSREHL